MMEQYVEESHYSYIALILSTTLSFFSVHSKAIEKPLFKWFNKHTETERTLLSQRGSLKSEQQSINMVDEFAKYSKLQRKINLIDDKLKEINSTKPSNSFIVQLLFTYSIKLGIVLTLIILSIYYRYTPVLSLPNSFNLMPFTQFICYPNAINSVSFYFWSMCTATVARSFNL